MNSVSEILAIARQNGATYELHSNTPIPDRVKS